MTANELEAWAELYDAHGAIARELGPAIDTLAALDAVGAPLDELAATVHDVARRVMRAYDIAAAERERWAR